MTSCSRFNHPLGPVQPSYRFNRSLLVLTQQNISLVRPYKLPNNQPIQRGLYSLHCWHGSATQRCSHSCCDTIQYSLLSISLAPFFPISSLSSLFLFLSFTICYCSSSFSFFLNRGLFCLSSFLSIFLLLSVSFSFSLSSLSFCQCVSFSAAVDSHGEFKIKTTIFSSKLLPLRKKFLLG